MNMKVCYSALPVLCLALRFGEANESFPMQSLHCYNDYTSLVTCTWQECTAARRFLQLNLYHEDNLFESSSLFSTACNSSTRTPCEPQKTEASPVCQDSCVYWTCQRTTTNFAFAVKDKYTFQPDRELQAMLNISLFQTGQPLPPLGLAISVTEAGDFLLAWEAVRGRRGSQRLHDVLEFEVTYKKECESWEKSSSVAVSNSSHYLLKRDALVPGSTYVARVRSRANQVSEWSRAVTWRFQEDTLITDFPLGDEAQPKNLRCMFIKTDQLTCSWEVRREITSSVLFTLFYRATAASDETECSPVQEMEFPPRNLYLSQSCEISITEPSHYLITVHPKKKEKLIQAYKNIKPRAPINVTVTKMKDQEYELRWTKQELSYEFITQRYEFRYWKTGDALETFQNINVSNDKPPFILPQQKLEPSTQYTGKMRARLHVPTLSYDGPWSEWSDECTWGAKSAFDVSRFLTSKNMSWALSHIFLSQPLMIPIFIIPLIAFGWCSYKNLLSKKKKWEEKIPNPGKSHVLQSYMQKAPLRMLQPGSQLDFVKESPSEKTEMGGCIQVLNGHMKVSSAELPGAEAKMTVLFLDALDLKKQHQTLEMTAPAPCPSAPAGCQSSHGTSQSLSPAPLPGRSSVEVTASQTPISCFDFNGPYLHLPHPCSQPDIQQDCEAV